MGVADRPLEERDYQVRIIGKALDAYNSEKFRSILIESPTGSGKTVMGLSVLKRMSEIHKKAKFNWVAMRTKLLRQAEEENERVKVPRIKFISMFDRKPPKADFMVTDEAQHDAARTCAEMHEKTGVRWSLGLTATPFRTDRIKLTYEKIINDCGVRFLVEQGWLSPFRQFVLPKWDPETVATRYLAEPERWGKSVFFFVTRDLCLDFHNRIKDSVNAACIFGDTPWEEQERIHDEFDNGKIKALTNIFMLTEGFDSPDLRTVWVRDSGRLCTMQMAGRVLRKDPSDATKVANIIQSEETRFPYTRVTKSKEQYVWQDGQWRSIYATELVEQVSNRVREILYPKPITLPSFLGGGPSKIVINKKGQIEVKASTKKRANAGGDFDVQIS